MFAPWVSNAGVVDSDGPVASLRVQAAEVSVARVNEAIASHFVVVDIGFPFSWRQGEGDVNLLRAIGVY